MRDKFFLFLLFLCAVTSADAQTGFQVEVDSNHISLGDQIPFRIVLHNVSDDEHMQLILPAPEEETMGEWIDQSDVVRKNSGGTDSLIKELSFIAFDTGQIAMSGITVLLKGGETRDTFYSSPLRFTVHPPTLEGPNLAPMEDILRIPYGWVELKALMLRILAILALAALLWYAYRYYKKQKSMQIETEVESGEIIEEHHWDIAHRKLEELKSEDLLNRGKEKEFQERLTHIVREFLEKEFHFPALESTTKEILSELRKKNFSPSLLDKMSDVLRVSDLVKYAKARPTEDIHREAMHYAFDLLQHLPKHSLTEKIVEEE